MGNGRIARLLATLMALQAGLTPLDFTGVRGQARQRYFAAIQAAMNGLTRDSHRFSQAAVLVRQGLDARVRESPQDKPQSVHRGSQLPDTPQR